MKLLRIKEASEILGLKTQSLRQLEKAGLVHPIRDWAGHRRFLESDIEAMRAKILAGKLHAARG